MDAEGLKGVAVGGMRPGIRTLLATHPRPRHHLDAELRAIAKCSRKLS